MYSRVMMSFTLAAFLSAFFTLVATHGLHIASGLLWMAVAMVQMKLRGLWNASRPANAPPVGYAGLAAK